MVPLPPHKSLGRRFEIVYILSSPCVSQSPLKDGTTIVYCTLLPVGQSSSCSETRYGRPLRRGRFLRPLPLQSPWGIELLGFFVAPNAVFAFLTLPFLRIATPDDLFNALPGLQWLVHPLGGVLPRIRWWFFPPPNDFFPNCSPLCYLTAVLVSSSCAISFFFLAVRRENIFFAVWEFLQIHQTPLVHPPLLDLPQFFSPGSAFSSW